MPLLNISEIDWVCMSPCHEIAVQSYPDIKAFVYKIDNVSQVRMYVRKALKNYACKNGLEFDIYSPLCRTCNVYATCHLLDGTEKKVLRKPQSDHNPEIPENTLTDEKPVTDESASIKGSASTSLVTPVKKTQTVINKAKGTKKDDNRAPQEQQRGSSSENLLILVSGNKVNSEIEDITIKTELTEARKNSNKRKRQKMSKSNEERDGSSVQITPKRSRRLSTIQEESLNRPRKLSAHVPAQLEKSDRPMSKQFDKIQSINSKDEEVISTIYTLKERVKKAQKSKTKDDCINVVKNFRGKTLQRILTIAHKDTETYFVVKFLNVDELCLVERSDANKHYPKDVIAYYEPLIQWTDNLKRCGSNETVFLSSSPTHNHPDVE